MKETYTIYIMPSSQNYTRCYSIRRWSIVSLIVLFSFVIVGAIGSIIWANFLNFEVRSKYRDYKVLEAKYNNREVEFKNISKEIEEIRELESQVRGWLGLEDGLNVSGLGQGGSRGGADEYTPDDSKDTIPAKLQMLSETNENKKPSLIEKARMRRVGLQQIKAEIINDMDEMARTPSINPIQKDRFWYTSGFGYRKHPLTGKRQFHRGLDISARRGSPVSTTAKGVIKSTTKDTYLGLTVKIRHNSTYSTVYGHLRRFATGLEKGDKVSRGDVIGYVGSSGRSTGPHVHYEVHENAKAVNPKGYILDK